MDKVVVVTGASGGIGAELARQLAAKGAKVVLAARRKDTLDAVAQEIGAQALAVVTDVTKKSDVERLAKAAIERFGRVDVWVNNAGRGISRSVADLSDEDLDAMWTVNMKSVVYGIQAVLPHFKSKNAGQIINISSGLSRVPIAPVRAAYGAVKSAVNMLTASLRVELKATHPGIHVTLLLPGVVATDMSSFAKTDEGRDYTLGIGIKALIQLGPNCRRVGRVEDRFAGQCVVERRVRIGERHIVLCRRRGFRHPQRGVGRRFAVGVATRKP